MRKYHIYSPDLTIEPDTPVSMIQILAPPADTVWVTGFEVNFPEDVADLDPVMFRFQEEDDDGDGGTSGPSVTPLVVGDVAAETTALAEVAGATTSGDYLLLFNLSPAARTFVRDFPSDDYIEVGAGLRMALQAYSPVTNTAVVCNVSLIIGENE